MNTHAEIRAALAAATPGPWRHDPGLSRQDGKNGATPIGARCEGVFTPDNKLTVCVTGPENNKQSMVDAHLIAHAPAWLRQLLDESDRLREALVRVIEATGGGATDSASVDFLCAAPEEVRLAIIGERERVKDACAEEARQLPELRAALHWMASRHCPLPCDQVRDWDEKRQRGFVPPEHKAALKAAIEG